MSRRPFVVLRRLADFPAPTPQPTPWPDDTPEWVETLGSRFDKSTGMVTVELIPRATVDGKTGAPR